MHVIKNATRTLAVITIFSMALLWPERAEAVKHMSLKEALKYFVPSGGSVSKVTKELSPQQLAAAKKRFGLADKTDYKNVIVAKNNVYLLKNKSGTVEKYVFIMEQYWRTCYHKFAVGVTAKGKIIEVKPMDLPCPYQRPIAKASFLKQFKNKKVSGNKIPAKLGADIDAVSGATASCEATALVARRALALYEVFFAN